MRSLSLRWSLLSAGILSALLPLATSASFRDVGSGQPYVRAIEALQKSGAVEGYSDGTFRAGNRINRAEFLKIAFEARGDREGFFGEDCFPDVRGEWFAKYICTAKEEDVVAGYPDGYFRPEQEINFVEATKILANVFKQKIQGSGQNDGQEWYEPYARALESSKAIPPSISGLDQRITRGEMAEMMWRLTNGITDQPSKGYLNVKYPEVKVNLAADTPQRADSCRDLNAFAEEARRTGYGGGMMLEKSMGAPVPAMGRTMESADSNAMPQSTDYSQTNVQVEGVDEGDIVKTDGTYLYVVQSPVVRIVKAHPASDIRVVATVTLDDTFSAQDLYIDGDRLIVLGHQWSGPPVHIMEKRMGTAIYPYPYSFQKAVARIYDVSDHSNPKLERTVALEGSLVSSRRIEDKLYLIVNEPVRWGDPIPLSPSEKDLMPRFDDSKKGTDLPVARCGDVVILPRVPSPQYLAVAVIPVRSPNAEVKRSVVLGNAQNVYASLENLYVATTEWTYFWDTAAPDSQEKTNIYRFALTDGGIDMQAQGSVPGHILNQFSMDEHEGNFRIATTESDSWGPTGSVLTNNLFVLSKSLAQAGSIRDIAPGEQIYSTRFLGDRAYMVTFRTIDPLFVIDTSDPRNPKILGKLKIPGFSNYIHPYDETHILGFGKEAVESKDGTFAWQQGVKVALFDVADVEHPKELFTETIGDRGTDSPLLWNHKALLFDRERNLLSFPVSVSKLTDEQKRGGDTSAYGSPVFQGAYVYDLTLKNGFKLRGTITHYGPDAFMKSGDVRYGYGRDIERVVRIGDELVTISQGRVQSNGLLDVKELGGVELGTMPVQPIKY
jgi:uncharacterized secreted protein with C-terminal beta-propeller domain